MKMDTDTKGAVVFLIALSIFGAVIALAKDYPASAPCATTALPWVKCEVSP